jgi:uncharacterized membrane protein
MLKLSLPYIAMKPGVDFLSSKQLIYHVDSWRISFYLHVFVSILVLVSGFTQFSKYIRINYPKIHRWFGMVHFAILLGFSAPSALVMSFYANGGTWSKCSFILLSLLWIFTTIMSLFFLRKGNYQQHSNWMVRSYALTLSAISLRLYVWLLDIFKIDIHPIHAYILVSWSSWVLNLLIAELVIKLKWFAINTDKS